MLFATLSNAPGQTRLKQIPNFTFNVVFITPVPRWSALRLSSFEILLSPFRAGVKKKNFENE
tara:strand:- start:3788 stop:3973 length:186 start_codon:yes stop_codon:yes gene_type:complete